MKVYQKPVVNAESVGRIHAVGQYIFEITPGSCSGVINNGGVGVAGGLAYCFPFGEGDGGFSADLTCANISGSYHVVYGATVPGGGLNCDGDDVSLIYPILSVSPELPADCIVEHFLFEGDSDECGGPQ